MPRKDADAHRNAMAKRSRDDNEDVREIGPLPAVVDPERRARGEASLEAFAKEYFPGRFKLAWAPFHRDAIARLEACTTDGGLYALSIQRGGGKTTLTEVAAIRAICRGQRRFVVIIQATDALAKKSLAKIQRELETNDALCEDFPEVVYPIRALDRVRQRAHSQTLNGEPTRSEFTKHSVTFPTVPGSPASGSIITTAGITGAIKGLTAPGPDGEILRPDWLIIDDCQTRKSAASPPQTSMRESVIMDDLLGLAGPETTIAAVFLCTPIYPNDLSERFLSHEDHPEWGGQRTKMLISFPKNIELWDRYWDLRKESTRRGGKGEEATAFYAEHRAAMDEGAVVAWVDRKERRHLSAIETAMCLYYRSPRGFHSEYQCEPEAANLGADSKEFHPAKVAERTNGVPRFKVPKNTTMLTAMIDPGVHVGWYLITAWNSGFGGGVVDYGSWPRQNRSNFSARDARETLRKKYENHSDPELVFAQVRDIAKEILGRQYYRDGEPMTVSLCGVDSGFEARAVAEAIKASTFRNILVATKGDARSTTKNSVDDWKEREGERKGEGWRLAAGGKLLTFDADVWKSFIYERLTTPQGGKRAITLFGEDPVTHEMFSEHVAAEVAVPTPHRSGVFSKWMKKPGIEVDNHLLDCLVGTAVTASTRGLLPSADASAEDLQRRPKKLLSFSDLVAKNEEKRRARNLVRR